MINKAAQGAFTAVSTVAGGAAGAIAGGVVGVANGFLKGSGLKGTPAAPTAESVLKAAQDAKDTIQTSTTKPETNNNTQIPRGAKLPEMSMAKVALEQGNDGVSQAEATMNTSLVQMEKMQIMTMKNQTLTSLMKAIAAAHEGVTKTIGKGGDAIKNNAS